MAKPITLRQFKGVSRLDQFAVDHSYSTGEKNVTTAKFPALSVRPGYATIGQAYGTKVLGIGIWKGTEIHCVFNDGTWRKWNGSAWDTLASGLNISAVWTFTNFQGNLGSVCLIGTNGVDSARYYNGTTVALLSGVPVGANYITQYADRLWVAVGNELHASSYRMADDWASIAGDDADSFYTVIETPDGEQIAGIKAGLTKLTITKQNSIHELFGYTPSDYSVRPVTYSVGMIGNQSGDTMNGLMYFLHDRSIRQYAGGMLPDKAFSIRVQDYVDRMNQTAKSASCVVTDERYVYIAIPIASNTPDTILVYDTQEDAWNVWEGINATCMAVMGGTLYIGDSLGRVLKMGDKTDNGVAIPWRRVSPPFAGNSMAEPILIQRMYITAKVDAGSTCSVYLSPSDSGDAAWVKVGTLPANGELTKTTIQTTGLIALTNWARYKLEGAGPAEIKNVTFDVDIKPMV